MSTLYVDGVDTLLPILQAEAPYLGRYESLILYPTPAEHDALLQIASCCTHISTLNISGAHQDSSIPFSPAESIPANLWPRLTHLHLTQWTPFSHIMVEAVGSQLEYLEMTNQKAEHLQLIYQSLTQCTHLYQLRLSGVKSTEGFEWIPLLASMTNLQAVSVSTPLRITSGTTTPPLPHLVSLEMTMSEDSAEEGYQWMGTLTQLTHLQTAVMTSHLSHMACFTQLTCLQDLALDNPPTDQPHVDTLYALIAALPALTYVRFTLASPYFVQQGRDCILAMAPRLKKWEANQGSASFDPQVISALTKCPQLCRLACRLDFSIPDWEQGWNSWSHLKWLNIQMSYTFFSHFVTSFLQACKQPLVSLTRFAIKPQKGEVVLIPEHMSYLAEILQRMPNLTQLGLPPIKGSLPPITPLLESLTALTELAVIQWFERDFHVDLDAWMEKSGVIVLNQRSNPIVVRNRTKQATLLSYCFTWRY